MEKKNKKGEQKEAKGGSKIKVVLITIIAILVIGAGGFFGYNLFWNQKGQTKQTSKIQQQVPIQQTQQGAVSQQNSTYIQQTVSAKTFSLDEFLVNLADADSKRYLKVTIFVGYDNKKLDTELNDKKPMLRDAVISVLTTKKAADITPKGIQNIKTEIIQRINPMLTKGQIDNIYFDDILVQ